MEKVILFSDFILFFSQLSPPIWGVGSNPLISLNSSFSSGHGDGALLKKKWSQ